MCARVPHRQIPVALEGIALDATEPDRRQRTASARALAEAVERFLDGDRHSESLRAEATAALAEARAHAALLDTATASEHERAMHSVTRALALAPGHREARGLLQQVLRSSPTEAPEAVGAELGVQLGRARAQLARTVAVRFGVWAALAPLLWLMGPLAIAPAVAMTAAVAGAVGLAFALGRRETLSGWGVGALVAASATLLAALSFIFGPFVLVPTLGATAAVLFSSHLRGRDRALAIAAIALAVLGPWALEGLGVVPASIQFADDQIRLLPRLVHFPAGTTMLVLTLATVSSVVTPAFLNGKMRDLLTRAEARVRLSAWYLEQLGEPAGRS